MANEADVHGSGDLLEVPGLGRVYYEVEGAGLEVTIVVPGGPGVSHVHYHPWFSELTSVGRVLYFDYPGTGRSDRLPASSYTVANYARALRALVDAVGVAAVNLISVSFGGIPALEFVLEHPLAVKRLVLSNAHLNGRTWQQTNIGNVNRELREQLPETWAAIEALRANGVRSLDDGCQELVAQALPAMEWYRPDDHPQLRRPETHDEEFNIDVYRALCGDDPEWVLRGALATYDRSYELIGVRVPTLLITGRHDRLTPPSVAHEIATLMPNAPTSLVAFDQSGHRPWAEESRPYLDAVAAFFEQG